MTREQGESAETTSVLVERVSNVASGLLALAEELETDNRPFWRQDNRPFFLLIARRLREMAKALSLAIKADEFRKNRREDHP